MLLGVTLTVGILVFRTYSLATRFLLMSGIVIISLTSAFSAPWSPIHRGDAVALDVKMTAPSQDLILLVLDGYGRHDVLLDEYGYDNSGFLGVLEAQGMTILGQAQSNYTATHASISSMLAQEYLITEASTLRRSRCKSDRHYRTPLAATM